MIVLCIVNLLLFTVVVPLLLHSMLIGVGVGYYEALMYVWLPCLAISLICIVLIIKKRNNIRKIKLIISIILASLTLLISSAATGITCYIPVMYNNLGTEVAEELQDHLKDPKSLEVLGMYCNFLNERSFYFEYTASNSFGGTVRSWGMYKNGKLSISSEDQEIWKTLYETYESLYDLGDTNTIRINHDYVNKKIGD